METFNTLEDTDARVKKALKGLIKIYTFDNCFNGSTVKIYARENFAYNISAVLINAMVEEGFFLNYVTLTQDNKPMAVFTTYKI